MKSVSENYIMIALKKEFAKNSIVPQRAAKFMVGDIRNEDKGGIIGKQIHRYTRTLP